MENSATVSMQLNKFVGEKLLSIYCCCEMLIFEFGNIDLHTQHFTRIIKDNQILLSTIDYQSWDGIDDKHNDEWKNLETHREEICGGIVIGVSLNELKDLTITLDNEITIQCFAANGYTTYNDEFEYWRVIFKQQNIHIVASNQILTMN